MLFFLQASRMHVSSGAFVHNCRISLYLHEDLAPYQRKRFANCTPQEEKGHVKALSAGTFSQKRLLIRWSFVLVLVVIHSKKGPVRHLSNHLLQSLLFE